MSKRLKALSFGLVMLCLATALACSHMRHLLGVVADKPQVRLVTIDVQSMSTRRMDLEFVLEVFNPNSFTIDIEQLKYSVHSLNLDLGDGAHKDLIQLKSHEKVLVRLPFIMDPDRLVELMRRYFQNPKELKIKLKADLFLGTAIGRMDMQFEEEKTIMRGLAPK